MSAKLGIGVIESTCWCGKRSVAIPVEWVRQGRTNACGGRGCEPGCELEAEAHDWYDQPDPQEADGSHHRRIRMNRRTNRDYNAAADSSPGHEGIRAEYPGDLILTAGSGLCPCGCETEPRGKNATFAMGHDIRMRGKLIRAAAAGAKVVRVTPEGIVDAVLDPIEYAVVFNTEKLNWAEAVRSSANAIKARTTAAERKLLEKAGGPKVGDRTLLKLGRWEYTGSVAAVYQIDGTDTIEVEYIDGKGATRKARREGADGKWKAVA